MKDVLINIHSKQFIEGAPEAESMELKTVGKFGIKDGKTYITYDDSAAFEATDVTTIVKVNGGQVSLQRTGQVTGRLVVEKGQRHLCCYNTAAGSMMVGIFGELVENNLTENGGALVMRYTIDINSGLVSRNEVKISVKEV